MAKRKTQEEVDADEREKGREAARAMLESAGVIGPQLTTTDADVRVRSVLRAMAWQRAKGELHALLATYWSTPGHDEGAEYEMVEASIKAFSRVMEDDLG